MQLEIDDYQKIENLRKRLYVLAKRKGLALQLCRKKGIPDRNTYRILNRTTRVVVHSASPGGYGLMLGAVEEYLTGHSAQEQVGMTPPERTATQGIPVIPKPVKPIHKATLSHKAIPTALDPSKGPGDPRIMTLADINTTLLEAVANNLQGAIERDTTQLAQVRSMIANAKRGQ
jgi:hypothetical protein